MRQDEEGRSWNPHKIIGLTIFCLTCFFALWSVSTFNNGLLSDTYWTGVGPWQFHSKSATEGVAAITKQHSAKEKNISLHDKLVGGLLPSGLDESSCQSRYEEFAYRKGLQHQASAHLISRLRAYEALHKKCGPHTESYNRTLRNLKSDQYTTSDCKYVVWISFSGLGNKMITLASAFLYALLTNRVLLVDPGTDLPDLFCEPFPETSWFLPSDFPLINKFSSYNQNCPQSFGNMLKNKVVGYSNQSMMPAFTYIHISHDSDEHDTLFLCDEEQSILKQIPWLILRTNGYFVPSLFFIPSFEQQLSDLFPEKDTVFHHLGRYLFHPTNSVWELITRYYQAYLDKADEIIGIQVRVFDPHAGTLKYKLDQIIACTVKENLLPQIIMEKSVINKTKNQKTSAVLITALHSGYSNEIRNMYWLYPTVTGEVISVHQPSSEIYQQTDAKLHDRKALAEMYLLSFTDKLVTTAWSTFGYVAQGLGGLKPWILYRPENNSVPDPPCRRDRSMEPCFHTPPYHDCKKNTSVDVSKIVPYVQHCEDVIWGIKLVG